MDSTSADSMNLRDGRSAARIYTLVTPYAEADLPYLKFIESADVLSICCWNQLTNTSYAPQDLSRFADNNWTLAPSAFQTTQAAPTGLTAVGTTAAGTTPLATYAYAVTAVNRTSGEESIASAPGYTIAVTDIAASAGSNQLAWSAAASAAFYNIYRANNNSGPSGGGNPLPPGAGS